ncbi:hypothetical protein GALMADRAFT_257941 [Galerina marginata CBS 339.88]|uniref:Uncharacterized protein n=1 Tax=Galerina marginata (strain CBS 339.88) TaxID=685588 RepID=A0A067SCG4_GALM3|nr:hypothetical protein GALMADRAFT_257941 [Galerina marginata CBS 339.88]
MPSLVLLLHIDAPPLKKRRGLAGSIVSTAVSAALIGTAVGLTVYRLWRDRGKEGQLTHPASASGPSSPDVDQQMPPPPYDPGAWKAIDQPPAVPVSASAFQVQQRSNQSGTQRSAKAKKVAASSKRPVGGGHHNHYSSTGSTRRPRARYVAGGAGGAGGGGSPRTRPEFDFGRAEVDDVGVEGVEQTEVEDKMDWIGDKLGMLIEQGRRALQSEVVVMSEAQEDEVDDGRGGWEEDSSADEDARSVNGQSPARSVRSRSGSVRARGSKAQARPRNIVPPPSSGVGLGLYDPRTSASGSLSSSPRRAGFAPSAPGTAYGSPSTSYTPVAAAFVPSSAPASVSGMGMGRHVRGASYESALPVSGSGSGFGGEDSAAWESPELRESMERARARLLAARRGGAAGS